MARILFIAGLSFLLTCTPALDAKKKIKNYGTSKKDEKPTRKEVMEFIRILGLVEINRKMLAQVAPQLSASIIEEIPNHIRNKHQKQLEDMFAEIWAKINDDYEELSGIWIKLFRKYYSREDIKNILAFYRTPTGQKSLRILPQASAESTPLVHTWIKGKAKEVLTGNPAYQAMKKEIAGEL